MDVEHLCVKESLRRGKCSKEGVRESGRGRGAKELANQVISMPH